MKDEVFLFVKKNFDKENFWSKKKIIFLKQEFFSKQDF
jgi:hypothetical protein